MGTLLFLSGQHIFVVILVVLLLFGADKLPEMAKTLGKGMRDFKKATDDIKREFETNTRDIRNDMTDIRDNLQRDTSEITSNLQKDA